VGKSGARAGDRLILTKPLGTGVLLAGDMRGRTASDHLDRALASMDQSNADALTILRRHELRALTDVTGFGLLGHLGEMLRASGCGAHLDAASVVVLPGAVDLLKAGVASSLQENNELALLDFEIRGAGMTDPRIRLLVDPQTSGGLLAAVSASAADACVAALQAGGYEGAALIGEITDSAWLLSLN
jgi:selenide,water dikinase